MSEEQPISAELLAILRDPLAVQDKETYGDDPGQLELVHNCWLVSKDTGYKYPIKEGIPVMLIEEGEKWKDVDPADLPVPPPPVIAAEPAPRPAAEAVGQATTALADLGSDQRRYLAVLLLGLLLALVFWRAISRR